MNYAIIPCERQDEISWNYAIPVGSLVIPRIETDTSTKEYIGLMGISFNREQTDEIMFLEGLIFADSNSFFSWRDQYGMVSGDE